MCGNDVQAAGAIRRAQQTGLQVPRDISITGFDNLEHAELVEPAITTVDVPHVEMGTRAATVLIDQLRGAQGARQINLKAPLVTRGSLGPAPD
jgi:LacI family transcriptional regulator